MGASPGAEWCIVADFNDPDKHEAAIAPYRDAGIQIISIGVQTFTGNVEVERAGTGILQPGGTQPCGACPVSGCDIRQGVQRLICPALKQYLVQARRDPSQPFGG